MKKNAIHLCFNLFNQEIKKIMNTKKGTVFIIFLILSCIAFGQNHPAQTATGEKMVNATYNDSTFPNTILKRIPTALYTLVPKSYQKNPDFGILPIEAPNDSCFELIQYRQPDYRLYEKVDFSHHDTIKWSQKSIGNINYLDSNGFVRAIDHRLKSVSNYNYEANNQPFPTQINIGSHFVALKNAGTEFQFARNLKMLYKDSSGTTTTLASANWSNYTVGCDGATIYNIFPNIDLSIHALNGSVETSFIIKSPISGISNNGWIIFSDSLLIPSGFNTPFQNDTILYGPIDYTNTSNTLLYTIDKAKGFDHSFDKSKFINLDYVLSGNKFDIYTPVTWLNGTTMQYPLVIDPIITTSASLAQASVADAMWGGGPCKFNTGCPYNLTVPTPANCTITNILWSFDYQTTSLSCYLSDGGLDFYLGACRSPGTAGYYWFCNSIGGGTCAGTNISIYSDLKSCLPAPACSGNLTFTMDFYTDCYGHKVCDNSCVTSASPWIMTLKGETVAQPAVPTSSSGTTVCYGHTTTLTATGSYGVPGYTYSWSPATGLSSTTTNPTTATISASTTYTITITDACGITATQSIAITMGGCLPIQLLNFNAQYNTTANVTNLNWATASESNNNYFTVERTLDGINYTTVDSVKGAGNSTQTLYYTGIDEHPVKGVDYYRLKQTDYDGNESFSNVVAVTINADGKANLTLIPNPVSSETDISFVSPIIGNALLDIYDYTGRLIKTQQIATNVGNNTVPLDVSNYNNGVYFISVNNSLQVYSARLVVNH